MTFSDEQINKIRALLNEAGDDWPAVAETLPEVRAYDHAHGNARAVVELTGPSELNVHYGHKEPYAILYRVEGETYVDDDGTERMYPAEPVIVNPTGLDGMREKIVGARAMFEAAAANPDLDRGFVQDLYDYLHGDEDDEGEGR